MGLRRRAMALLLCVSMIVSTSDGYTAVFAQSILEDEEYTAFSESTVDGNEGEAAENAADDFLFDTGSAGLEDSLFPDEAGGDLVLPETGGVAPDGSNLTGIAVPEILIDDLSVPEADTDGMILDRPFDFSVENEESALRAADGYSPDGSAEASGGNTGESDGSTEASVGNGEAPEENGETPKGNGEVLEGSTQAPDGNGEATDENGGASGDSEAEPETEAGGDGAAWHQLSVDEHVLTEDLVIDGNAYLWDDLDLNGHTLTISGDFLHSDGRLIVGGGTLHVGGEYQIGRRDAEGVYWECGGMLVMTNDMDHVIVDGDFAPAGGTGYYDEQAEAYRTALSAGVLELKGDIPRSGEHWDVHLETTGTHRIFLNGGSEQTIYLEDYYAGIENLEIAADCIPVWEGNFFVRNLVSDGTIRSGSSGFNFLYNYASLLDLNGHNLTILGDITRMNGDTITIGAGGSLNVQGNLNQEMASLILGGGTLHVTGNYRIQHRNEDGSYSPCQGDAALVMRDDRDYVLVEGDFCHQGNTWFHDLTDDTYKEAMAAGVLEIQGDILRPEDDNDWCFIGGTGTHKLLLSGTAQKVYVSGSSGAGINNLEIAEGCDVEWNGCFDVSRLLSDVSIRTGEGIRLLSYDEACLDFNGHDLTVRGDITCAAGKLTVGAGNTFTVDGNAVQGNAKWYLSGGTLHVTGDYRIQYPEENGTYRSCEGLLVMRDDADRVVVDDDFYAAGAYYDIRMVGDEAQLAEDVLSAGVIEVKGDFFQPDPWAKSFRPEGTHRVILNGDQKQHVCVASEESGFATLEITKDPDDYIFERIPCWDRLVKDGEELDETAFLQSFLIRLVGGRDGKEAVITGYRGSEEEIDVPASVWGYAVTGIAENAFEEVPCKAITLPESITRIGGGAFRGCGLLQELEIPYGVEAIEEDTFATCPSLRDLFIPDSVTRISGHPYDLNQTTLHVRLGSYAEEYAEEHDLEYVYWDYEDISSISLRVLDEAGRALDDGYSVYWRDGTTGQLLGSADTLQNTVPGQNYRCEVLLDEELGYRYMQPAERVFIAGNAPVTEEIVLTGIGQSAVTGSVTSAEGEAVTAAQVSFRQYYDNGNTRTVAAQTDEAGMFSASLDNIRTTAVVSAAGYYDAVTPFDEGIENGENLTFVLTKVPTNRIALTLTRQSAAVPGVSAGTSKVDSFRGLTFTAFNETKGEAAGLTAQYPYLYPEAADCGAGDVLRLSVTDEAGEVTADDLQVTLDDDRCANASWVMLENGGIQIDSIIGNGDQTVMLFDAQGRLAANQTVSTSWKSGALPEGTYTCIVMNKTALLRKTDALRRLEEYGLAENTDYTRCSASVEKGVITVIGELTVPDFDESKLYYTVENSTRVWSGRHTALTGQYTDIRATYQLDESVESTGETVRFELPEGVVFVPSSLTVDGKSSSCTQTGRTLTVPVLKKEGTIRFYVLPTGSGTRTFYASLLFSQGTDTIIQPLGSCSVNVAAATIHVPSKTASKAVTATGRAIANCSVTVYDNGTPVGTTVSGQGGLWKLDFELVRPLRCSLHDISAEVTSSDYQVNIETDTAQLLYNTEAPQLSTVTMINTAMWKEYRTVFDFQHPSDFVPSYTYAPGCPTFTFIVRFTGDAAALRAVNVVTKDSAGAKTIIPCVYDATDHTWTATHNYMKTSDLPCYVSASYETQDGTTYDLETDVTDLEGLMTYGKQVADTAAAGMADRMDINGEEVNDESVSFNLTLDGKTVGIYEAEALDYAQFNLSEWENESYQVYEYEDGSLSYELVVPEGAELVTYTAYPQEELYVRESMLLVPSTSVTDPKGFSSARLGRWYDVLKKGKDLTEEGLATLSGLDAAADFLIDYQNLRTNEYLLRDGLNRLRGRRDSCKCVDNSIYDEAMDGLEAEINDYARTAEAMLAGAIAVNVMMTALKGKVGKLVFNGYFKITKKLYRFMQKKAGFDTRGRLKFWHKRGLEFGAEGEQQLSEDVLEGLERKRGLFEIAEMTREANQNYFNSLQNKIYSYINMFRNQKCKCVKCECYKEEEEEEQPVIPTVDPSGYVYEAVPSNRVAGVEAQVYYYDYVYDEYGIAADEKSEIFWNAQEYNQVNPQMTSTDGTFAWDVPEGRWVVRLSKEGYEDADSTRDPAAGEDGYLPVPPIQTEVNTAIVSKSAPTVKSVSVTPYEARIEFSQYMQPETVTAGNVTVTLNGKAVAGSIEPVNAEADYQGIHTYASVFVFKTTQKMSGSVTVTVKSVKNYNGAALTGVYQQSHKVLLKPESLQIDGGDTVFCHGDAYLTVSVLPKEAGANRKITVVSQSPSIVSVQTQDVTTDAEGKAVILLHGNLAGAGVLAFSLAETDISAEKIVKVDMPGEPVVPFEESAFPVTLTPAGCMYNGKEQKPAVTVKGLTENTDFRVTYTGNKNAGTARVLIQGLGKYSGTIEKTFVISKAKNAITASDCRVNASTKAQTLSLKAKATGGKITYKSGSGSVKVDANGKVTIAAKFAGKATITVTAGDANYQTVKKTVTVTVNQIANKITAANQKKVCKATAQSFYLGVKRLGTGKITYKSNQKNVTVSTAGKVTVKKNFIGKAVITISVAAAGMYKAAKKTVTVTVNPAKTPLKSAANAKGRKLVLKWTRYAAGGGYQIQYSLSPKFASGNKTITVSGNKTVTKTIGSLKKGKTYYVRIRVIKKIGNIQYSSGWGTAKKVKITK